MIAAVSRFRPVASAPALPSSCRCLERHFQTSERNQFESRSLKLRNRAHFFWRWCARVTYGRTLLTGDGYHMAKWIVSQAENETRTKNLNVVTTAARAGSKARRAGLFSDAARAGLPVKSF